MKSLVIAVLFLTIFSCKNSRQKHKQTTITDTIAIDTASLGSTKTVQTPSTKESQKDTIRNEELTQMNEEFFQKAIIDLKDSSLVVYQNIRADYRIFGYQRPDTNSKKMVFFSVFTPDVKGNPYSYPYGSYYYSGAMKDTELKYVKNVGAFVKVNMIKDETNLLTPIYILKDWVTFEKQE